MGELIANTNRTIGITPQGVWLNGPAVGHTYQEQKCPSVDSSSSDVLHTEIGWTALGCTWTTPPHTFIKGGSSATAMGKGDVDSLPDDIFSDEAKEIIKEALPENPPSLGGASPIEATADYAKCNGNKLMRQNDTGTCKGQFILNSPPYTVDTCTCTFKISSAGQNHVKAE